MGSNSVFLVPAHLASLWSLCRAWWWSQMASTIPACAEGCAHHSGWTHTLHLPPHWTGVFRGLGCWQLHLYRVVVCMSGARKIREGKGETRAEGGPFCGQVQRRGRPCGDTVCLSSPPRGTGGSGLRRPAQGCLLETSLISCSHDARYGN